MERKLEIIRLVENCPDKRKMLDGLGIPRSTYYGWLKRYRQGGAKGLERKPRDGPAWNRLTPTERQTVIDQALHHPHLTPRELAFSITDTGETSVGESSVYRILKAEGLIREQVRETGADKEYTRKTRYVNEQWQSKCRTSI